MGCDIHIHSEIKIRGTWHHHSDFKPERNYAMFAKMANVRNDDVRKIKPISEPKGIPDDATFLTKLHVKQMEYDGHSHSWLSAEEILQLYDFIRNDSNPEYWFGKHPWTYIHENFTYFMGDSLDGFMKHRKEWQLHEVEDVRFVFFFDN
jgi:hypothetical protein